MVVGKRKRLDLQRVDKFVDPPHIHSFDIAKCDAREVHFRCRNIRGLDIDPRWIALELVPEGAQQREGRYQRAGAKANPKESGKKKARKGR